MFNFGANFINKCCINTFFDNFQGGKSGILYNNHLTIREVELLLQIADGKKNFEIAEILFITPNTVKSGKARLIKKLNLKSTAMLLGYAIINKENLLKIKELIFDLK